MVNADRNWSASALIEGVSHVAGLGSRRGMAPRGAISAVAHGTVGCKAFVVTAVSIPGGHRATAALSRLAATL